jgi:hypothetical protein
LRQFTTPPDNHYICAVLRYALAVAAPIPAVPPVMSATLPSTRCDPSFALPQTPFQPLEKVAHLTFIQIIERWFGHRMVKEIDCFWCVD